LGKAKTGVESTCCSGPKPMPKSIEKDLLDNKTSYYMLRICVNNKKKKALMQNTELFG